MTQLRPAYRCGARVEHVKTTLSGDQIWNDELCFFDLSTTILERRSSLLLPPKVFKRNMLGW